MTINELRKAIRTDDDVRDAFLSLRANQYVSRGTRGANILEAEGLAASSFGQLYLTDKGWDLANSDG